MNFTDACEFLDNIENINYGGCGVAALALYRWLQKNESIDGVKIVFCYSGYEQDTLENNRSKLDEGDINLLAPSHVMLYRSGRYFDSEGGLELPRYPLLQFIELSVLLATINEPNGEHYLDGWNETFDREAIPVIEKGLDVDLSDIEV